MRTDGTGDGHFFAVDRRAWASVCGVGLNAAVAYLVIARFSGKDNRTTAASVNAVETHTGISRSRAKAAVAALLQSNAAKQTEPHPKPRYWLTPWGGSGFVTDARRKSGPPDWIWLPNAIVTGAAGETPPLDRVRQTQDVMTLRALVDLYHAQNLVEDGGISRKVTYQQYDRTRIGERGTYVVWGFRHKTDFVHWSDTSNPHRRDNLSPAEKKAGENPGVDWFRRFKQLVDLGLVEWIPTLHEGEGEDAEIIHPCGMGGSQTIEDRLGWSAHEAGESLLTEGQRGFAGNKGLWPVPVPRHLANVAMIGVARLYYRPHTKLTGAWWHELTEKGERFIDQYEGILRGQENRPRLATSR